MSKSQAKNSGKNATTSNKIGNSEVVTVEAKETNETLPSVTNSNVETLPSSTADQSEKVSTQAVSLITASNLPTLTEAKKALNETAKRTLTGFFAFFMLYKKSLFRLARINELQIRSVDNSLTTVEKNAAQIEALELTNKLTEVDKEFKTFLQLNSSKLNMAKVHNIFTADKGSNEILLTSDLIQAERIAARKENEDKGKTYKTPLATFDKSAGWSNNYFLTCLVRAAKKDKTA